ncbi:hypothetical protein LINPERHAP1_LOCUS12122 [Linum perenne]
MRTMQGTSTLWKRPASQSFVIVTGSWLSDIHIGKGIELPITLLALVMATHTGATVFLLLIVILSIFLHYYDLFGIAEQHSILINDPLSLKKRITM